MMHEAVLEIKCRQCFRPLSPEGFNTGEPHACAHCGASIRVDVFPALLRSDEGASAEAVVLEQEAECFHHPGKRAVVACDACGRFLCALCDLHLGSRHVCPSCLESGTGEGSLEEFETEIIRYDQIALSLAFVPLIIFPFVFLTIITGPAAVYYGVRHWKAPMGQVKYSKAAFVISALTGALETFGWIYFFFFSR